MVAGVADLLHVRAGGAVMPRLRNARAISFEISSSSSGASRGSASMSVTSAPIER